MAVVDTSIKYPIMEHFYTVQGEGRNAGKAAYFFRIGGCDVGCPWCDVKESWSVEQPHLSIAQMLELLEELPVRNIVITGGEPCSHDLEPITNAFKAAGYSLWLETSGAYSISGDWDWIVVSPKRRKNCLEENWKKADELKVVIVRPMDFSWANDMAANTKAECQLYFQPEWSREDEVLPQMINYVKANPEWSISLQTHKYMQIP